ncbi:hypothetical protein [Emticicia soli]|uniref:Uncharacterized protein n=1 Tax=Emticicia soli TaxID=2027878 RepID=A0ABW5JA71_9BACT
MYAPNSNLIFDNAPLARHLTEKDTNELKEKIPFGYTIELVSQITNIESDNFKKEIFIFLESLGHKTFENSFFGYATLMMTSRFDVNVNHTLKKVTITIPPLK